jgi:hypothetical protein
MYTDPNYLTTEIWDGIDLTLRLIWILFVLIFFFVVNFLTAHALIPSLLTTKSIPEKAAKLRPILYFVAMIFFIAFIFTFYVTLDSNSIIAKFYGRFWI